MLAFLTRRAEWLIIVGLLLSVGGGVAAYFLPGTWEKAEAITQKPQTIPVQELAAQQLDGTRHVIVTDFTCGENYAFELHTRAGNPKPTPDQKGYGKAWIPLFPKPAAETPDAAPPRRFVVLFETTPTVASGSEFHVLSRKHSIDGLAVPLSRRPLKPDIRKFLAEGYPETDFQNCLVVVQYEGYERDDAPVFATILAVCTGVGLGLGLPILALGLVLRSRQVKAPRSRPRRDNRGE